MAYTATDITGTPPISGKASKIDGIDTALDDDAWLQLFYLFDYLKGKARYEDWLIATAHEDFTNYFASLRSHTQEGESKKVKELVTSYKAYMGIEDEYADVIIMASKTQMKLQHIHRKALHELPPRHPALVGIEAAISELAKALELAGWQAHKTDSAKSPKPKPTGTPRRKPDQPRPIPSV